MSAIFSLQEDEAEEYNEKGGIQESTGTTFSYSLVLFKNLLLQTNYIYCFVWLKELIKKTKNYFWVG